MKGPPIKLELIWRDPDGKTLRKFRPWRKAATREALEEYLYDYFELLTEGYKPLDFDYIPVPHCARIHQGSSVLAEWITSLGGLAESLVTARLTQASRHAELYPSPATTNSPIEAASRPQRSDNARGSAAKATDMASGSGIPAA